MHISYNSPENKHLLETKMKVISKLQEVLFSQLTLSNYVLLNPIPFKEASTTLDILFRNEELKPLVEHLQQVPDLSSITLASSFKSSKAILKFKDNAELIINFIHQFTYKSLIYLDEEEVQRRKVKDSNSVWIPCVEHIFEHLVLKSFLEFKGISRATFEYFSEFHILIQEDLLDYFNVKYGTSFSSMYQLTDFDETQRVEMIKQLKNSPANHFMKKVNVRWHNFLGTIRQARVF